MPTATRSSLKVADEVWIVTALLHRENPRREDFKVGEIVERAKKEALAGALRPGVYVHAVQHCVANRQPNPARYRILFETGKNLRRLFRKGDSYHHARESGKVVPEREDLPEQYRYLLDWYLAEYNGKPSDLNKSDPLLALRGSGKELWADEHADEYVRRLREGWE
jgi:hypothetical protein